MTWRDYQSKYRQFLISIHQAQLTTLAAGGALESFPRNLPDHIATGLTSAMRVVAELLERAVGESTGNARERRIHLSTELGEEPSPVFSPMLSMYALVVMEGQSLDSVDFQSTLYRQQLVMVVAHAEAFFGDSVRAICSAEPRVLESEQKQISWSTALGFPNRQSLLAELVDQFVGSMMHSKDICGLLAQLKKMMGLEVTVAPDQAKRLSLAEQVRHVIVHNGGRVDTKFLERTGSDIPVGQLYPVDKEFVDGATNSAIATAQALFEAVSKKYFSIAHPLQSVGWRMDVDGKRPTSRSTRSRVKRAPG